MTTTASDLLILGWLSIPVLGTGLWIVARKTSNPLHPVPVIAGSFALLAAANLAWARSLGFYPLNLYGLGAIITGLASLAAGGALATLAYPPLRAQTGDAQKTASSLEGPAFLAAGLLLLFFCLVSNLLYWRDMGAVVGGIGTAIRNPWLVKQAELSGRLDPYAAPYFFRSSILVAVALALAAIKNPGRLLPRIAIGVYALTVLANVRRDPMLIAAAALLGTAVVAAENPRRLILPLAAGATVLLVVSVALLRVLESSGLPLTVVLFGYTAGNLSSFQAVVDGYYPRVDRLPLEHSLYFFYSAAKYLDPALTPAPVIKPNPEVGLLPNTYSFLADYYLDLGPAGLVLVPLGVGAVAAFSYGLAIRRPTFFSFCLFAAVYAASVRSWMNNDWSWLTIPTTAAYAAVAQVVLLGPIKAVVGFLAAGGHRASIRVPT
jgi:oligosaccharide repeat unit polymerase